MADQTAIVVAMIGLAGVALAATLERFGQIQTRADAQAYLDSVWQKEKAIGLKRL